MQRLRPPANTGPGRGRVLLLPPSPRPRSLPRLGCSQPGQPVGLPGSGLRLPGSHRFRTTGLQGGRRGSHTAPRSQPARSSPHRRPQPPAQCTEPGNVCRSQSRAPKPERLSRERPPGCGRRPPHGRGFGQLPALGLTPTCSEPSFPTVGFASPRLALCPRPAVTGHCSQRLRPRPPRPPATQTPRRLGPTSHLFWQKQLEWPERRASSGRRGTAGHPVWGAAFHSEGQRLRLGAAGSTDCRLQPGGGRARRADIRCDPQPAAPSTPRGMPAASAPASEGDSRGQDRREAEP